MTSMVVITGCNSDAASTGIRQQSGVVDITPPAWIGGEQPVLRHRRDAARGRLWTLTAAGVDLYDEAARKRLARIELPGWLWVDEPYASPPDLAIGPNGEAVISSNVVPTLWRIDPVTLKASEHALLLDDNTGRDIGFTGLAYSAQQGAYFAISPFRSSLWRIDPLLRRGQHIPLSAPLLNARGLGIRARASAQRASRFVELCIPTDRDGLLVDLAPDQRSGYVRSGICSS
jgi:hypothetical protein